MVGVWYGTVRSTYYGGGKSESEESVKMMESVAD